MEIVESLQHCEDGPPEGGGKGQNGECYGWSAMPLVFVKSISK